MMPQDPTAPRGPEAWNAHYTGADTPWDLGAAHPELVYRLPELGHPGRAFVGGAGRAHDALALAQHGWRVTATDWAPAAADAAAELERTGSQYVVTDSLGYDHGGFDLVFEHTFFCAIDPSQRADYGAMANRILVPGGRLAAIVFPVGKDPTTGGPPWGISTAVLDTTLGAAFTLLTDEPVRHRGHPGWRERWAVWVRND
jgi:NAD(P)-dependent dehydrogenase (short-subunit alcohol dehydrogenase family)